MDRNSAKGSRVQLTQLYCMGNSIYSESLVKTRVAGAVFSVLSARVKDMAAAAVRPQHSSLAIENFRLPPRESRPAKMDSSLPSSDFRRQCLPRRTRYRSASVSAPVRRPFATENLFVLCH